MCEIPKTWFLKQILHCDMDLQGEYGCISLSATLSVFDGATGRRVADLCWLRRWLIYMRPQRGTLLNVGAITLPLTYWGLTLCREEAACHQGDVQYSHIFNECTAAMCWFSLRLSFRVLFGCFYCLDGEHKHASVCVWLWAWMQGESFSRRSAENEGTITNLEPLIHSPDTY